MEQVRKMNLPIVGRVQHGEQQILNQKRRVVELGYFIAKIKNDNMQFLLNRFNETYNKETKINIRFFDEEPLSVRRIRYNQGGAVCYCMENQEQGKQKVSNVWQPISCSESCKYRVSSDGKSKPMCNIEGTLKFLLPEISTDRIWLMKITGYTSIKRLQTYIDLQKQIGNSVIGDYTLFLKQEEQTNKFGKTFNNYILDIIKKEDFISNNSIPENQTKQLSTNTAQTVNNDVADSKEIVTETQPAKTEQKVTQEQSKETKVAEKKTTKKTTKTKKKDEVTAFEEKYKDHYFLFETTTKTISKAGKPTEYLVVKFADVKDNLIDVVIPPQFADEILECDIGTEVILDLAKAGDNTFTKSIVYEHKLLKNVAA